MTTTIKCHNSDLRDVDTAAEWIARVATAADKGRVTLDLRSLHHDRSKHVEILPLAIVGWWLLGTPSASNINIVVPASLAAVRQIARSGLITAAIRRLDEGLSLNRKGEPFLLEDVLLDKRQPRLPLSDWEVYDDLSKDNRGRLRIVPDLEDPRRAPEPPPQGGRYFPWLARILAQSSGQSEEEYLTFVGDADDLLFELLDNVHRWANASKAVAACAVTLGGGKRSGRKVSWNRLHLVIMDTGVGIRQNFTSRFPEHTESAVDLVARLLASGYKQREVEDHNGHGLWWAAIAANRHFGNADVLTYDDLSRGTAYGHTVSARRVPSTQHPHVETRRVALQAIGTLVHVTIDACCYEDVQRDQAAGVSALVFDLAGATSLP